MQIKNGKVKRTDKLNAEFKKEIYEIISRKLQNPDITEMFSVTEVDTSGDLSHAKVYISVFSASEEKKRKTFNAICESAGRVRYFLSKSMRVRTVPELRFLPDDSMAYGDKMDKLFLKIKTEEESERS